MAQYRMKRVNEGVKRELSMLIRQYLPVDQYGLISVTGVEVSKDLKNAVVFISTITLGPESDHVLESLEEIRSALQSALSKRVSMKYTPQLKFKLDQGLERGHHMIHLLDSLGENPKS